MVRHGLSYGLDDYVGTFFKRGTKCFLCRINPSMREGPLRASHQTLHRAWSSSLLMGEHSCMLSSVGLPSPSCRSCASPPNSVVSMAVSSVTFSEVHIGIGGKSTSSHATWTIWIISNASYARSQVNHSVSDGTCTKTRMSVAKLPECQRR